MNCLILKHEQDAKTRQWTYTTDEKELVEVEKRLLEIREIFNKRHDQYYPSWEEVENCRH